MIVVHNIDINALIGCKNFLMLAWCPDYYKTNETLLIQIGFLEPDLWVLEILAKFVDVGSSLFTFCYFKS